LDAITALSLTELIDMHLVTATNPSRWPMCDTLTLLAVLALVACDPFMVDTEQARTKERWAVERAAFHEPLASAGTPRREYTWIPTDAPERAAFRVEREVFLAADPARPETFFGAIAGIAVDVVGNVYILDIGAGAVKVFGPAGRYLYSIGDGVGQGPGQLGRTGRLAVGGGRVFYMSGVDRRFVTWSLDGRHVGTRSLRHRVQDIQATDDGTLIASWRSNPDFPYTFQIGNLWSGGGVAPLASRARHPPNAVVRGTSTLNATESPTPRNRFTVGPNRLYLTTAQFYEVLSYDLLTRAEAWILTVSYPRVRFTDADREAVLASLRARISNPRENEIEWPTHYPSLDLLLPLRVDGRGRLYVFPFVKERELGHRYPVDVYDGDGNRIAVGTMPHISWAAAHEDFVYGIEPNASDEFDIVRYRLILPPSTPRE
jgi:hypothetical protein